MNTENFIEKFAEIFDETDATEITLSTNFKELEEWSSLMALSTIAMADEEYNVVLKAEEIRQAQNVEELYNIILSKLS